MTDNGASVDGLFQQVDALRQSGQGEAARAAYRAVLESYLGNAAALYEIGRIAVERGDLEIADAFLFRAVDGDPGNLAYLCALGFLQIEMKRYWDAEATFRKVLRSDRQYERAYFGIALNFQRQDKYQDAAGWWGQLIALAPGTSEAYINLGAANRQLHRFDLAAHNFAAAASLLPENSERGLFARIMRALTLLAMGDWVEGWKEYESRLKTNRLAQASTFSVHAPRWTGEVDPGKVLVVFWEQGYGDTIHFARYLKYPVFDGMKVVLHCQESLVRLMQISFGTALHIASGSSVPFYHWQTPIMSMPFNLLGRSGGAIPNEVPYLTADPDQVSRFRQRLEAVAPGKRRLGLVWRGNPKNLNDFKRSIDWRLIALLLDLDAAFFIIQPDESVEEFVTAGYTNIHSLADEITDFADSAAALTALDGVVSVDTSVAHLAGALNRPLWLLLPDIPDWRWGLLADKTEWYPSARLFRQPSEGDWPSALVALASNLTRWLAE